jgi:HlyD family secretion protein
MTATARIVKAQARGVLRVPSQALRFTPAGTAKRAACAAAGKRVVWTRRDSQLACIPVKVGLDDDSFAQIIAGDLKPGDRVITGQAAGDSPRPDRRSAAPTPRL